MDEKEYLGLLLAVVLLVVAVPEDNKELVADEKNELAEEVEVELEVLELEEEYDGSFMLEVDMLARKDGPLILAAGGAPTSIKSARLQGGRR